MSRLSTPRHLLALAQIRVRVLLVSAGLMFLALPHVEAGGRKGQVQGNSEFQMKEMLRLDLKCVRNCPEAELSWSGDLIYLLYRDVVKVLDVRTTQEVAQRSFRDLPCKEAGVKVQRLGWPLSMTSLTFSEKAVVNYCGSLYRVNSRSLEIERQLVDAETGIARRVHVVPNRDLIAVAVQGTHTGQYETRFLSPTSGELAATWPMYEHFLRFSPDGKLAVVGRPVSDDPAWTGGCLQVRSVPDGRIHLALKCQSAYSPVGFLPPDGARLAAAHAERGYRVGWVIFAVADGRLLQRIQFESRYHSLLVAPDWSYAISSLSDDPGDTDVTQEFIVWDPMTGRILYQSPKKKYTILDKLQFGAGIRGRWLYRTSVSPKAVSAEWQVLARSKR